MRILKIVIYLMAVAMFVQSCSAGSRGGIVDGNNTFEVWYSTVQIRGNAKAEMELETMRNVLTKNGIEYKEQGIPSSSVVSITLVNIDQSIKANEVCRTALLNSDKVIHSSW